MSGGDGARGGNAQGTAPPQGGAGGAEEEDGGDGDGAVASIPEIIETGTTTKGGGGAGGVNGGASAENGEIQLTYSSVSPAPPSNVQITDSATEGELTVDWDEVSSASGYYVYRAESSGSTLSDYTEIADVTTPPYTDTNLEDGERYNYRVSSHR